jgi:hypothetical protein
MPPIAKVKASDGDGDVPAARWRLTAMGEQGGDDARRRARHAAVIDASEHPV